MTTMTESRTAAFLAALLSICAVLLYLVGTDISARRQTLAQELNALTEKTGDDEAFSRHCGEYVEQLENAMVDCSVAVAMPIPQPTVPCEVIASNLYALASETGMQLQCLAVARHHFDDQSHLSVNLARCVVSSVTAIATEGRAYGTREQLAAFVQRALEILPHATDLSALELQGAGGTATRLAANFTFYSPLLTLTDVQDL